MGQIKDILFYGLITTGVAAALLAAIPGFRPERAQFADRFVYFLWRYCVPVWGFQELALRIFFGRFYP
jgi:hypothetical protein